jgi:hypothetical protein
MRAYSLLRCGKLIEIVEVEDAVGHSKTDFLSKSMGMGRVWIQLKDLETMKRVADANGVNFIFKKGKEYFFRAKDVTHYYKE